jgi:hypothetical protein
MSRKRRNRRERSASSEAEAAVDSPAAVPVTEAREKPPLPDWKWKTFPVYFALSLGLFVGAYAGYVTGFIHSDSGNSLPSTIMFGIAAVLLGFGVARLGVRGLMGWGVIRPTPKRK